jgi:hypothetical protein
MQIDALVSLVPCADGLDARDHEEGIPSSFWLRDRRNICRNCQHAFTVVKPLSPQVVEATGSA